MDRKKYICLALILLSALLLPGCSYYGRLREQPEQELNATIRELADRWADYSIYYWHPRWPHFIVFDPKGDDKVLKIEGWAAVSNKSDLSSIIKYVKRHRGVRFFKVLGPKGKFFGFLFGAPQHLAVKVIDGNTLHLYIVRWVNPSSV